MTMPSATTVGGKLATFLQFPLRDKIWFAVLYAGSGVVRLALLMFPFRWYMRLLGRQYKNTQLSVLVNEQQREQAWRIGSITALAAKYTPWESKCLVQASVAILLLGYYKIPYVMYCGVSRSRDGTGELKAHAWLSVGPWVVTGRDGHTAFTITSTFVAPAILES